MIVDDDESLRQIFAANLEARGLRSLQAENIHEALNILSRFNIKYIILDQCLGDELGTEMLPEILKISPYTKVVFISSNESVSFATDTMSLGACGFLQKSNSVENNVSKFLTLVEKPSSAPVGPMLTGAIEIVGVSEKIQAILEKIMKIRDSDTTVLLSGESGVGKELFAQTIHKLSERKDGPFIAVNCAAISESLLEAELFGWKKGAFTDAKSDRKGYFEACSGGTLLLDEIAEMSPSLQSKLLRVLQEKEVTPVGSCHPIKIDTRILAATNRNLKEEISEKKFREDLYYRLAVVTITIPPLRERPEDIEPLVESFLKVLNKKLQKKIRLPNTEVYARLKAYFWPGNVRELYNAIERASLLAVDDVMRIEDLLPDREVEESAINLKSFGSLLPLDYGEAKSLFEKNYFENLLKATNYNISAAAKISHQDRTNIYRIIKKHKESAE